LNSEEASSAIISHHQPSSAIISHHQPSSAIISHHQPSSPKDDDLDEVNEAILLALSDEPFSSGRQIARMICVPTAAETVYCRLVDSLHFKVRHQTSSLGSSQTFRQSEGKSFIQLQTRIAVRVRSRFYD
jgi:hypothetical protein